MPYRSLADLAMLYQQNRFGRLPQSRNIEDRRANDPLAQFMPLNAPQFSQQSGGPQMESRIASPLSAQAGFGDIPEFDERASALASAFGQPDRRTAMDEFRASLAMNEVMNRLRR